MPSTTTPGRSVVVAVDTVEFCGTRLTSLKAIASMLIELFIFQRIRVEASVNDVKTAKKRRVGVGARVSGPANVESSPLLLESNCWLDLDQTLFPVIVMSTVSFLDLSLCGKYDKGRSEAGRRALKIATNDQ